MPPVPGRTLPPMSPPAVPQRPMLDVNAPRPPQAVPTPVPQAMPNQEEAAARLLALIAAERAQGGIDPGTSSVMYGGGQPATLFAPEGPPIPVEQIPDYTEGLRMYAQGGPLPPAGPEEFNIMNKTISTVQGDPMAGMPEVTAQELGAPLPGMPRRGGARPLIRSARRVRRADRRAQRAQAEASKQLLREAMAKPEVPLSLPSEPEM
jgi:hypothetical protein